MARSTDLAAPDAEKLSTETPGTKELSRETPGTEKPSIAKIVFFDDSKARQFEPFALTRPASELICGALVTRERWERFLGATTAGFIGAQHLRNFDETGSAKELRAGSNIQLPAGTVVVNSRCIVSLDSNSLSAFSNSPLSDSPATTNSANKTFSYLTCEGKVCAIRLNNAIPAHELAAIIEKDLDCSLEAISQFTEADADERHSSNLFTKADTNERHSSNLVTEADTDGRQSSSFEVAKINAVKSHSSDFEIAGRWINEVWDYVGTLSPQLIDDIMSISETISQASQSPDSQIGNHPVFIEEGAVIEPFVFFDTTSGPILVRAEARICAFTRLTGPCYIGNSATILGESVANCSIGPLSKIRGEIHSTIVLGYSNKGHSGFVGHSYLGRWVNLGAGTTTSNLKNTYGSVQLWTPNGLKNTGEQFLGTFFGDHSKTGIGTMLNTGTVLSIGANVYGGQMPPKYVPPFAWGEGEPYGKFEITKFIEVARKVMKRRGVEMTDGEATVYRASSH